MNQELKMTAGKLKAAALTMAVAAMLAFAFPAAPAQAQGPVTVSTNDDLGSAKYMDSTATWNPATNQVTGSTHIYVHHAGSGFTGGVSATLNSASGQILATMPQVAYGVDGTAIFWGHSSRTEHWSFAVDPKLAGQVASITIMDSLAPHNRLADILGQVGSVFNDVVNILNSVIQAIGSSGGNSSSGDGSGGSIEAKTANLARTADLISHVSALEMTKATTVAVPHGTASPIRRPIWFFPRLPFGLTQRLNISPAPPFHSVSPAPPRR